MATPVVISRLLTSTHIYLCLCLAEWKKGRGIAKTKINFNRMCINLHKKWHIPLGYYGTEMIPVECCGKHCCTKSVIASCTIFSICHVQFLIELDLDNWWYLSPSPFYYLNKKICCNWRNYISLLSFFSWMLWGVQSLKEPTFIRTLTLFLKERVWAIIILWAKKMMFVA